MNVEPKVQQRLLDLAEIDAELVRIAHRRSHLPEDKKIEELAKEHQVQKDSAVAVEMALDDLDRDIRKLEIEIDSLRRRYQKDNELMIGGTVAAKQLVELEREVAGLTRRRGLLEDELIDVMERREATEADYQHVGAQLSRIESDLADVQRQRDEALADLDVAERRCHDSRAQLVPEFPADLLGIYEKVRRSRGTGAGLLRARRCGACRIELDSSELSRIATSPPELVVRCEECGAILVRTHESGL